MRRLATILLICLIAALALSSVAQAAPAQLWQVPEGGPGSGEGAGQIDRPLGIAVSPVSGDVYVADAGNSRIDQFTAWGVFVRAFGWNVDASNPEEKLQVCTAATGCKAGTEGAGPGQLRSPQALALDSAGDLYVLELKNYRVQKFDSEGQFLLMFGGEVDKTTSANICAASLDVCGSGVAGSANGFFGSDPQPPGTNDGQFFGSSPMAVGPDDSVYVANENRIQVFDTEGAYQSQIGLPKEGEVKFGRPEGKGKSGSLAISLSGDLYFDFALLVVSGIPRTPGIFKHTGTGWSLVSEDETPEVLAVGSDGNLFAADKPILHNHNTGPDRITELDPTGARLIPSAAEELESEEADFTYFGQRPGYGIESIATSGSACGIPGGGLYVAYSSSDSSKPSSLLAAYGAQPDPALCPPPVRPPAITDQYATAVASRSATLRAAVNSRFWTTTTYYVEYGTEPCSLGGCQAAPAPPGAPLNSASNSAVTTGAVALTGLAPGTTYHYRFVATTKFEPGPGGEATVKGVGGEVGADGAEGVFTTREPTLPAQESCANQGFRSGPSAFLPDCRAYELVSPLDKEGGEIATLVNVTGYPARLDLSASSGERFTYSAYRPFAGSPSANTSSQYLAARGPGGWSTEPLSPPFGRSLFAPGANIDREYKLFSPDLCEGWLRLDYREVPVLDPAAVDGYPNLFRRGSCGGGAGDYEALSTLAPPHLLPSQYLALEVQGVSADGQSSIYVVGDDLPGTGAPEIPGRGEFTPQLYVRAADGTTRFACYLPNGTPSAQPCYAGNASISSGQARKNQLTGALSADGEVVFFTTGGQLYRRSHATEPQSAIEAGACTEEEMACTRAIPQATTFWAASPDGARVLYATGGGALRVYDSSEGTATQLSGAGTLGVMGQSEDLSRVYFAATAKLAPGASAGNRNLYFYEAGEPVRFLGVLAGEDVLSKASPGAISAEPILRAARVSPDGLSAAFLSRSPLSGYDNTDQQTGEPDAEVYLYRADAEEGQGRLLCVSCDPGGARPLGRVGKSKPWNSTRAAAWIPAWEADLTPSSPLSDDGSRLFFNSYVPLVARDTNGRMDVYEWQASQSSAGCVALGAERYAQSAGGCLSLISSGESALDSEFLDASPSGGDVFFATAASLVNWDPGLLDVYDARRLGGLPAPPSPPAPCEGEACQSPPEAPDDPTPASAAAEGPGNVREAARAKHKRKKHRHHKQRKHHKQSKHAKNGRTSR